MLLVLLEQNRQSTVTSNTGNSSTSENRSFRKLHAREARKQVEISRVLRRSGLINGATGLTLVDGLRGAEKPSVPRHDDFPLVRGCSKLD